MCVPIWLPWGKLYKETISTIARSIFREYPLPLRSIRTKYSFSLTETDRKYIQGNKESPSSLPWPRADHNPITSQPHFYAAITPYWNKTDEFILFLYSTTGIYGGYNKYSYIETRKAREFLYFFSFAPLTFSFCKWRIQFNRCCLLIKLLLCRKCFYLFKKLSSVCEYKE